MAFLKCKMCGGTIEFENGATVGICDSCGTKQTLPKRSDDVITNLFNRANNMRLKCEFDKAEQIYEKIVEQDDSEAEAHWGIVLCKYGIEYVEDPATGKRIPTCHRTLFESILKDTDYSLAIDYSDASQQSIYENEARAIDRIQKGILSIVNNEKPFDVFICYKETDENGKRTIDSTIANDIYYQLTQEGFKVFYAAITLEDKLGQEYEPYIFAALNSSKVMLAVGTKPEYFGAVWVRNEWSRFMKLMKTDRSKLLIPCYRDMDAYELPEEFAHLQSQDMSKIGFINDLVRGIKKVVKKEDSPKTDIDSNAAEQFSQQSQTELQMIKRGQLAIEDEQWDEAREFFNRALDENAESGEAYFGLLMTELQKKNNEEIKQLYFDGNLQSNRFYKRVIQFKTERISSLINEWNQEIEDKKLKEKEIDDKRNQKIKALNLDYEKIQAFKVELNRKLNEVSNMTIALSEEQESRKQELYKEAAELKHKADENRTIFNNLPEHNEVKKLNERISILRNELSTLGIFKGKRKKEIQGEIDILNKNLNRIGESIYHSEQNVLEKEKQARDASRIAEEYDNEIIKANRKELEEIYLRQYWESAKGLSPLCYVDESTVLFGYYMQESKSKTPIRWRILDRRDNKLLLLSDMILEHMSYNEEGIAVTWETCTLRKWLNSEFIKEAFDEIEQQYIDTTEVIAEMNPMYATDPGNNTEDKIFLLSISEVEKYHLTDKEANITKYAYCKHTIAEGEEHDWILRSPGDNNNKTAYVTSTWKNTVEIIFDGDWVLPYGGVRPAMWISI